MNRSIVGTTMVASAVALAVSAIAAGASVWEPQLWQAAVRLAVLGGVMPMIFAVNIRIVPVFARRSWCSERMLLAQVASAGVGAWLSLVGTGLRSMPTLALGQVLALVGGVLFMANIASLFRQQPMPVPPAERVNATQATVDTLATKFMRLSSTWLVLGLAAGVALVWWEP